MPRRALGSLQPDRTAAATATPSRKRGWARRHRLWTVLAIAVLVSVALVAVDEQILSRRITHVHIRFPQASTSGETWVLVGSDERTNVPKSFGTSTDVPGHRADVVLVVHRYAGHTVLVSVPRDLLVRAPDGTGGRVALTLQRGPQALVDGLCSTLRIPASHLAVISMTAFVKVVNAVDGVPVTIEHPVRDPAAELALPAGHFRLTGYQALALIRSRHPQQLVNGRWVGTSEVGGAASRTQWAGSVLASLQHELHGVTHHPIRAQRVAWAATSGLTTDQGTGLLDLMALRRSGEPVVTLPSSPVEHGIGLVSNAETTAALDAAGYSAPCTPR